MDGLDTDARDRWPFRGSRWGILRKDLYGFLVHIKIRYLQSHKMHTSFIWRRIFRNMHHCFLRLRTHTTIRGCTRQLLRFMRSSQDPAIRHPCPHLRDSLTGHRSRRVVSMFWSEPRMNGDLENCAVIYEQGSVSTPSYIISLTAPEELRSDRR